MDSIKEFIQKIDLPTYMAAVMGVSGFWRSSALDKPLWACFAAAALSAVFMYFFVNEMMHLKHMR